MSFDIVVHGCTGYTGRLVTYYLANLLIASDRTFAVAGRSKDKIEKLLKEVDSKKPIPIIIADSFDTAALDAMCKQAKCVIACAGPFAKFGMPLVEACIRNKTHYVDITGETPFVRDAIVKHDAAAKASGVYLLPCSGFDSVPSDISNFFAQKIAQERGDEVVSVQCLFSGAGSPSRGTLESICNIVKAMTKADLHPNSLVLPTEGRDSNTTCPRTKGVWYNSAAKKWQAPFVMAAVNEKVARRSNHLLGRTLVSYHESSTGGLITCIITTFMMYAMVILFVPFIQNLLKKYVFPAPGTGPSDEQRNKGKFKVLAIARLKDATKPPLMTEMFYNKDAYTATAIFAAETALAIVCGETNPKFTGGFLTPASLCGEALLKRLPRAGISISVK